MFLNRWIPGVMIPYCVARDLYIAATKAEYDAIRRGLK
jgi:hypothetical protein